MGDLRAPRANGDGPLKVALLAPPWLPVPPPGYGGIEQVVHLIADGLVDLGHDVWLFCAPGSSSRARVQEVLAAAQPEAIGAAVHEADHVARAFGVLDREALQGRPFDVLHDHCGFTALAMADRIDTPVVHTLHGPFTSGTRAFYRQHGCKATLVAISRAQRDAAPRELPAPTVVPNPLDVENWPFQAVKQDYLLWIGRVEESKGPHLAVAVAAAAGVPLLLAGPVQPGQEEFFAQRIAPHVDGTRVRYVGEVGLAAKKELYAGARALLMPIRWEEPFGLVMVEAQACGTPVLAFPEGAAPEIVQDGVTGFLVPDEQAMAGRVRDLKEIDPATCRAETACRFRVRKVAKAYEQVYRRATPRSTRRGFDRPIVTCTRRS